MCFEVSICYISSHWRCQLVFLKVLRGRHHPQDKLVSFSCHQSIKSKLKKGNVSLSLQKWNGYNWKIVGKHVIINSFVELRLNSSFVVRKLSNFWSLNIGHRFSFNLRSSVQISLVWNILWRSITAREDLVNLVIAGDILNEGFCIDICFLLIFKGKIWPWNGFLYKCCFKKVSSTLLFFFFVFKTLIFYIYKWICRETEITYSRINYDSA